MTTVVRFICFSMSLIYHLCFVDHLATEQKRPQRQYVVKPGSIMSKLLKIKFILIELAFYCVLRRHTLSLYKNNDTIHPHIIQGFNLQSSAHSAKWKMCIQTKDVAY
jgi:hypothetical protein